MSGNSITLILVGRASGLDHEQYTQILRELLYQGLEEYPPDYLPNATWQIIGCDSGIETDFTVNLRAGNAAVLKQLCLICNGQWIGVTAELPSSSSWPASGKIAEHSNENGTMATYTWRLDSPNLRLTVTRLEILGDAQCVAS